MHKCHVIYTVKNNIFNEALNSGSAWHGTKTMGFEHAPVRSGQPHTLEKRDSAFRQNKQQKTESANMKPVLSTAFISGPCETRHMQKYEHTHVLAMQTEFKKQRQNKTDNHTYLPFPTTTECLSNSHFMHCSART